MADIAATGGDPRAITAAAAPHYSLIRHLAPLFQLAYQGAMTPALRQAALGLRKKVLPSYEKINRGEDVLENMRTLGDGFFEMRAYELALYAYKFVLFHVHAGEEASSGRTPVPGAGPASSAPLLEAARQGDSETVWRLLREGAEVNATMEYGWTALGLAARSGKSAAIVRMLLDFHAGTDLETRDESGYTRSPRR